MGTEDLHTLVGMTTQESEPARSLVSVVEEAMEAQRDLEHQLRVSLGLNNTDFRALLTVFRRDRRGLATHPRDLTRDLGLGSGATSQVVSRLVAAGMLERNHDPADARAGLLTVTTHGLERLTTSTTDLREDLNELITEIDADEETRLIELLDRVRDIYRAHHRPPN